MALTASGDKSGALVRDGVCSALQGQGLTPTETLEERIDLIFTAGRQAGRQADSAFGSWLWKCKRCVKAHCKKSYMYLVELIYFLVYIFRKHIIYFLSSSKVQSFYIKVPVIWVT